MLATTSRMRVVARWALGAGLALATLVGPAAAQATVVIVVRHAERAPGTGDVPISEAGQERARALAEIGRVAGVQAVVHTQFQRTRQTAEPLAQMLGIVPAVVSAQSDIGRHAAEVAAAVRQHVGKTVLVVGHSNTVAPIVAALGGPRFPDLCDSEYDGLYTLVVEPAGTRLVRSKFGAPSGPPEGCPAR